MLDRSQGSYISNRTRVDTPESFKKTHQIDRKAIQKKWFWLLGIVIGITVLGIVGLGYAYIRAKAELAAGRSDNNSQQTMLVEIGRHMVLPNEEPTTATVNDASKLSNQEFFKDAKDGDKVFIFPKANKALLYRPSSQKVIEYAKVTLDGLNQQNQ